MVRLNRTFWAQDKLDCFMNGTIELRALTADQKKIS